MKMRITVEGKAYEVDVQILDGQPGAPAAPAAKAAPAPAAPAPAPAAPVVESTPAEPSGVQVTSPIAGVVVSVQAKPGDTFNQDETLLVLEAMKMESNIAAPATGTIKEVHVNAGDNVEVGQLLVSFV